MDKEYIVLITEGERTEVQIIKNLQRLFFNTKDEIEQILISFKTDIYKLWKQLKKDEFETDIIEVLIEQNNEVKELMEKIDKKRISQKYLFFDYDGQACTRGVNNTPGDTIIQEMISNFDDETDSGKIYISYPMVEAIKHLNDNMKCSDICHVKAKTNIHYKNIVSRNSCMRDLTRLNNKQWNKILNYNIKKANCIVSDNFSKPTYKDYSDKLSQVNIFSQQYKKFIENENEIAILSAFPFFVIDYFGEKFYNNIVDDNYITLDKDCNNS